jgi:hypothetical protein
MHKRGRGKKNRAPTVMEGFWRLVKKQEPASVSWRIINKHQRRLIPKLKTKNSKLKTKNWRQKCIQTKKEDVSSN